MREILNTSLGRTTFGGVLLEFRNKALVHPNVHPRNEIADVERIYKEVDMLDPTVQADYKSRLEPSRDACLALAFDLAAAAGIAPEDLGLHK